jgi:hypothetical protein
MFPASSFVLVGSWRSFVMLKNQVLVARSPTSTPTVTPQDRLEFKEAWEKAGRSMGEAVSTFQAIDANCDGRISWDEFFIAFVEDELEADHMEEAVIAAEAMEEQEWVEFVGATAASLSVFAVIPAAIQEVGCSPGSSGALQLPSSPCIAPGLWQDKLMTNSEEVVGRLLEDGVPLHCVGQVFRISCLCIA